LYQTNYDRAASYTNYGHSVVNVAAPGGDFISGNDGVLAPGGTALSNGTRGA
jgi:hypothetical protein